MLAISSCDFSIEARVWRDGKPGRVKIVLPKTAPENLSGPPMILLPDGAEKSYEVPGKVCFSTFLHNTSDPLDLVLRVNPGGVVTVYSWFGQDGIYYRMAAKEAGKEQPRSLARR